MNGKRTITGKMALYFFGIVNLLMLLGPVLLPAYRSFIKVQYARIWRSRNFSRKDNDLIELSISQLEFDQYREGSHEIWLGHRLYDIAEIREDGTGVRLRVEFDQEETSEMNALSRLQQQDHDTHKGKAISGRWLNWLSELVQVSKTTEIPEPKTTVLTRQYIAFTSAIRHCYQPVGQQPPDVQFFS